MILPSGWAETNCDALIARIEAGRSFKCEERRPTLAEVGVLKVSAVSWTEYDELESKTCTDAGRVDPKLFVRVGDFLFSRANTIELVGACVIARRVTGRSMLSDKILRFTLAGVSPEWLMYALRSADGRRAIESLATGNQQSMRNIGQERIRQIMIRLPPWNEQRRIVGAVEEQLSRVDAGVSALVAVKKALARYRASVLKAACEGRLVPTEAELARAEGRTYEHASDLLARVLTERRNRWVNKKKYAEPTPPTGASLRGLPDGWVWATVVQLNESNRPCAYGVLQPGDDVRKGIPFVRVGDIDNGRIAVDELKRISPEIATVYPRTKLRGGEVVLTLVGTIGRTAVAPASLAGGNVARAVGVLPLSEEVSSHWVEIWFRNPERVAELTAASHEVARKTLNLEDLRKVRVALPPHAEQHRIVAEVERRLSIVDEVAASVDSALARAARLRQSILKRAFEGKLVPQDSSDEPASVLLARVRAEREKDDAKPTKRKSVRV